MYDYYERDYQIASVSGDGKVGVVISSHVWRPVLSTSD